VQFGEIEKVVTNEDESHKSRKSRK